MHEKMQLDNFENKESNINSDEVSKAEQSSTEDACSGASSKENTQERKKEIKELSQVVHEEIWGMLSEDEESTVNELAKKRLRAKTCRSATPLIWKSLKTTT